MLWCIHLSLDPNFQTAAHMYFEAKRVYAFKDNVVSSLRWLLIFDNYLWYFTSSYETLKGYYGVFSLWCFLTVVVELYLCAWRLNVSWFCWDLQYWYWLEFLCNSWIYMIVNKGWKIIYLLCKLMPELFYLKTKVVLILKG